ncbi:MAG: hypothetical protein AB7T08_03875 [Hyphomonadaceae bacterium]
MIFVVAPAVLWAVFTAQVFESGDDGGFRALLLSGTILIFGFLLVGIGTLLFFPIGLTLSKNEWKLSGMRVDTVAAQTSAGFTLLLIGLPIVLLEPRNILAVGFVALASMILAWATGALYWLILGRHVPRASDVLV